MMNSPSSSFSLLLAHASHNKSLLFFSFIIFMFFFLFLAISFVACFTRQRSAELLPRWLWISFNGLRWNKKKMTKPRCDADDFTMKLYRLFTDWESFKALRFSSLVFFVSRRNNSLISLRRNIIGAKKRRNKGRDKVRYFRWIDWLTLHWSLIRQPTG